MQEQTPIRLDVEAVVRQKIGNRTPGFVVSYLKHIVHEDTINKFFREHSGLKDYDFIRAVLGPDLLKASVAVSGAENLPHDSAPVCFVSNHPLGGLDGMILALYLGEQRNYNVRVIVNELLMYLTPLQGIFVPVHVSGKGGQNRDYAQKIDDLYTSRHDILTFPSGMCSRKIEGKVQDPEWKKSVIQKSVQHKRDIVPIYFDGQNSGFFYNLALWRTRLGIKTNIEMLYLADEMFKATGKHFSIKIGKPIPYTTFDRSRTPQEWAQWVRNEVYNMSKS
ncbi:MAG: glycerol acyltransferase [Paludibacteraceae bacterium]|nr:glycerol acyltransferase [Paludibacteraceae bacterium]